MIDPADLGVGHPASPTGGADPAYWHPHPRSGDVWTARGFPAVPGVVERAAEPFTSTGVGTPWRSVYGNHDCLVQGRAVFPDGYDAFLTGAEKPVLAPDDCVPETDALQDYVADPWRVSAGPRATIPAAVGRRRLDKAAHVVGHFRPGAVPDGHGYTEANVADGTAYYVWDGVPGVRLISLDTTNPAGHVDGCVDGVQFDWLRARLAEVGAASGDPRLVVLLSHHGLSTLTNDTRDADHSEPVHLADEVEALLHEHPQVVLWLSGHIHVNRVTPRPRPDGGGFWEIATSAVAEWPVQLRHLELGLTASGAVITSTIVDSLADLDHADAAGPRGLAGLHREAAANDPGSVGGIHAEGRPCDRNVQLPVVLPAALLAALHRARGGAA